MDNRSGYGFFFSQFSYFLFVIVLVEQISETKFNLPQFPDGDNQLRIRKINYIDLRYNK